MGYELDAKIRLLYALRSLRRDILRDVYDIKQQVSKGMAADDAIYESYVLDYEESLLQEFISGIHLSE